MVTRSRQGPALSFTLAFSFASVLPVYTVFLMLEPLNYTLVFVAYFFWLYKEVATARPSVLSHEGRDLTLRVITSPANAVCTRSPPALCFELTAANTQSSSCHGL
jgi:hypothetical protein